MRTLTSHAALAAGLLPLLFAACSTSPAGASAGRTVADGGTFTMKAGERVTLADDSRLRYVNVTNDSRCPPDKQCVWAGDAEVVFEWQGANGAPETFSLHTGRGERSHRIGDRTLSLETLARGADPEATLRLAAASP